jgi:monoamine oxidase
MQGSTDTVIVGGGIAGLSTARALVRAGRSAVVLEARERVGGRTATVDVAGTRMDVGGQWLAPQQHRMQALVRAFGLATFPTFHSGRKILELHGARTTYAGSIPSLPLTSLLDFEIANRRMEHQRATVPVAAPHTARQALRLDAHSLGAWASRLIHTAPTRAVFDAAVRTVFGAEPSELSALYFLAYSNAGGGFLKLVEVEGAAQEQRLVDGAQSISDAIARELGTAVVRNAPVRAVDWDVDGATVHSDAGAWRARRVVLALAPALIRTIRFSPALPPAKDQLLQRIPMGSTIKCVAVYERPFWRDAGLSGEVVSDGEPLSITYDNTSADGPYGRPGRLHRRRTGPPLVDPLARRSTPCRGRVADALVRRAGRTPAVLRGQRLERRSVVGRLPGRRVSPRRADHLRGHTARAGRLPAFRRHRDGHRMDRLHGRRGAVGRTSRRRGHGERVAVPPP